MEIVDCALAGVDAFTMGRASLGEMMKQPMTDTGLVGLLEDFNRFVGRLEQSGERLPEWVTLLG